MRGLLWSVLGWPMCSSGFSWKVSVLWLSGVFGGHGADLCLRAQLVLPK